MFRKTALGLAAAVTLAAALTTTASTASAGAKVNFHFGFGVPAYGYSHPAPYPVYAAPYPSRYHCKRVFVGYKKVWTGHRWKKRRVYRRHCY